MTDFFEVMRESVPVFDPATGAYVLTEKQIHAAARYVPDRQEEQRRDLERLARRAADRIGKAVV